MAAVRSRAGMADWESDHRGRQLEGLMQRAAVLVMILFLAVALDFELGLVALAALVTRVYQPLTGLTNARVDLMTSMVSFERVFEVLDAPEPIADRPGAVDLVQPRGRVTFRDVSFRYPPASASSIASTGRRSICASTCMTRPSPSCGVSSKRSGNTTPITRNARAIPRTRSSRKT